MFGQQFQQLPKPRRVGTFSARAQFVVVRVTTPLVLLGGIGLVGYAVEPARPLLELVAVRAAEGDVVEADLELAED